MQSVVQGSVREMVAETFRRTAFDQERKMAPLTNELVLLDSGLDSLCFALIVTQLEDDLGVDPFSDLDDGFFPVTFAEFVKLYETAVEKAAA